VATRIRIGIVLLLCSIFLLFTSVVYAQMQGSDCSYLVARQSYANAFGGFINIPVYFGIPDTGEVGLVPNAGAGMATFYPGGKVTNTETILIGLLGLMPDDSITGTYKLRWDTSKTPALCTGTMSASDAGGTPYNFQLTVSPDGKEVQMIHTDTGLIVTTTLYPMNTNGCRKSTITGKYIYNTKGWGLIPGVPLDQTLGGYIAGAMSGAMQFLPGVSPTGFSGVPAGAGSIKAWDTLNINGTTRYRQMFGWYIVNPDCTGKIVLRDPADTTVDFQIEMFVGRGGSLIHAVNINTVDMGGGDVIPIFLMPIPMERIESSPN
jgi:hypothetical protein